MVKNEAIFRKFSLILIAIVFAESINAQSQVNARYASLLDVNPSFAGSNGSNRVQSYYNAKTLGENASEYASRLTFDSYLSSFKSGIGVSASHYNYNNIFRTTSGHFVYSKYFSIGKNIKIIPSLEASYTIKEVNLGWYSTSAFITSGSNSQWVRTEYLSLNSGILLNFKGLYTGFSMSNLNTPDIGVFAKQTSNIYYKTHASYNMKVSENLLIHFYGQYYSQQSFSSSFLSVNALFYKRMIYGLGYEPGSGYSFNTGFRADCISLQLSAKKEIYRTGTDTYFNSWQIMLSYNFRKKDLQNTVTNFEAW